MFRPMLATDFEEARLRFPYFASPKLDGIRCLVLEGGPRTRSMKPIPNTYIHNWFMERRELLANMDGELIVGEPTAKDCYGRTSSGVMGRKGQPDFGYFVFDIVDAAGRRVFSDRAREGVYRLKGVKDANVGWLEATVVNNMTELARYEEKILELGYEGVMLRHPEGRYKQGRATVNEGTLLKVKRFKDAEAVIVGVVEQQFNANPGYTNEIGRTARSSAAGGKIGKDTLGALVVEGLPGQPFAGVRFNIGTGMDDALRAAMWARDITGLVVRYRYFDIGVKDAPRHPVFSGFRESGS
jgi:DNA ligase-1